MSDEERLFLEALRAYSAACRPPDLQPACPFLIDEGGVRHCGAECEDLLGDLAHVPQSRQFEVKGVPLSGESDVAESAGSEVHMESMTAVDWIELGEFLASEAGEPEPKRNKPVGYVAPLLLNAFPDARYYLSQLDDLFIDLGVVVETDHIGHEWFVPFDHEQRFDRWPPSRWVQGGVTGESTALLWLPEDVRLSFWMGDLRHLLDVGTEEGSGERHRLWIPEEFGFRAFGAALDQISVAEESRRGWRGVVVAVSGSSDPLFVGDLLVFVDIPRTYDIHALGDHVVVGIWLPDELAIRSAVGSPLEMPHGMPPARDDDVVCCLDRSEGGTPLWEIPQIELVETQERWGRPGGVYRMPARHARRLLVEIPRVTEVGRRELDTRPGIVYELPGNLVSWVEAWDVNDDGAPGPIALDFVPDEYRTSVEDGLALIEKLFPEPVLYQEDDGERKGSVGLELGNQFRFGHPRSDPVYYDEELDYPEGVAFSQDGEPVSIAWPESKDLPPSLDEILKDTEDDFAIGESD